MISPTNFGDKDPIALFAEKLREEYTKENYVLAKKLDAKNRIFVPVIVRGEEDKGVRLWQFGKQVYEELLALAVDDEIGDYTDIVNGRDLTVETVGPESTGTPYNKSSVRVRLKTSPLSGDATQVETWTNEQPNPKGDLLWLRKKIRTYFPQKIMEICTKMENMYLQNTYFSTYLGTCLVRICYVSSPNRSAQWLTRRRRGCIEACST